MTIYRVLCGVGADWVPNQEVPAGDAAAVGNSLLSAFSLEDATTTAQRYCELFGLCTVVARESVGAWWVVGIYRSSINIHVVTVPPAPAVDDDDDVPAVSDEYEYRYCDGCGADRTLEPCICDYI